MKYVIVLLALIIFVGCTNPREPAPPSSPVTPEIPPWHPDHEINKP